MQQRVPMTLGPRQGHPGARTSYIRERDYQYVYPPPTFRFAPACCLLVAGAAARGTEERRRTTLNPTGSGGCRCCRMLSIYKHIVVPTALPPAAEGKGVQRSWLLQFCFGSLRFFSSSAIYRKKPLIPGGLVVYVLNRNS